MHICLSLLRKTLRNALPFVHSSRLNALFVGVESLAWGRKLSVTGLGRNVKGKAKTKHAIKRMDRLIGNENLHAERFSFYQTSAKMLVGRTVRPILIVDWSDLSPHHYF